MNDIWWINGFASLFLCIPFPNVCQCVRACVCHLWRIIRWHLNNVHLNLYKFWTIHLIFPDCNILNKFSFSFSLFYRNAHSCIWTIYNWLYSFWFDMFSLFVMLFGVRSYHSEYILQNTFIWFDLILKEILIAVYCLGRCVRYSSRKKEKLPSLCESIEFMKCSVSVSCVIQLWHKSLAHLHACNAMCIFIWCITLYSWKVDRKNWLIALVRLMKYILMYQNSIHSLNCELFFSLHSSQK